MKTHYLKQLLVVLVFTAISLMAMSQLKTYDLVKMSENNDGKSKVIYLTGLWCKPCMSKLKPLMDTFSKQKDIDFFILFDRYGINEESLIKLYQNFDTSYFGLLPEKYYPVEKHHGLITIKTNASNKAINSLISDYNFAHHTTFTRDDIWVGVAFIKKRNANYITKEVEIKKLIAEINLFLKGLN